MRKDLEAAFSRNSHNNLRVNYLAIAEHVEFTFFFSSQSPDAAILVLLHNMHHLSTDLSQDI